MCMLDSKLSIWLASSYAVATGLAIFTKKIKQLHKTRMHFFTMGASQCQTLSCKEPKILENSKEHLLVCCLLIRVLLAQHFTYITHLLGKQIDSFVCFLVTLAGLVLLESGSRFLPVGKSFRTEGRLGLS